MEVFKIESIPVDFPISKQAVLVGAIIGILINIGVLLVPSLNYVGGGGLVAGFVGAYLVGGPRGWLHGIMAGIVAGLVGGIIVVLAGGLLGLYLEPPTLLQDVIGLISPLFDGIGIIGLLFIFLGSTAFIVVDSIIGGFVGGVLRMLVDTVFNR